MAYDPPVVSNAFLLPMPIAALHVGKERGADAKSSGNVTQGNARFFSQGTEFFAECAVVNFLSSTTAAMTLLKLHVAYDSSGDLHCQQIIFRNLSAAGDAHTGGDPPAVMF
ncbi:MAG TPA: hypothetical protein VMQ76_03155, partial [Terracidiphilus sp.]|nr:hypothetical protein [Terracidiphilus sp.]